MSRRQLLLVLVTVLGAVGGAALSAMGGLAAGPAVVLGGAAMVALGGEVGAVLASVALLAGLAAPVTELAPLPWWSLLAAALALGLTARALTPQLAPLLAAQRRAAGAAALCAVLALAMLLPDGAVRLAHEGAPVMFHAVIRDATTGAAFSQWHGPLVPHASPTAGLGGLTTALALAGAFALLVHQVLGFARWQRPIWTAAFLIGALGVLIGLVGLAELAIGSGALPDAETLRHAWSLRGSPLYSVASVDVPLDLALAPWSRPMVDGVRLLLGALLAASSLRVLAPSPPAAPAGRVGTATVELPLALGASLLAALLAPISGLAFLLGAGALLLLGALVVGRWSAPEAVSPAYVLVAALALPVVAWTAAAANWFPA